MSTRRSNDVDVSDTDVDARTLGHAERLTRARKGGAELRRALLEELEQGEYARLSPFLEEAGVQPRVPDDLEDRLVEDIARQWNELEPQAPWTARFAAWWSESSRRMAFGGAGLVAAAAAVALVVFLPAGDPSPQLLYAAAETDGERAVSVWLLDATAARPPSERGTLFAAAVEGMAPMTKGPGNGPSKLQQVMARLESSTSDDWSAHVSEALSGIDEEAILSPADSKATVSVLESVLEASGTSDREVVVRRAERLHPRLSGAPRSRFALRVGQYFSRVSDAPAAEAWLRRAAEDADASVEVGEAARRLLSPESPP